jgi:hypothetical protein
METLRRTRASQFILVLTGCAIGLSLAFVFLFKHEPKFVPLPTKSMPPASIP